MSDDDKPTISLRFEAGPYDGLTIAWSGDAADCPTAITLEHHRFDRSIEPDMGHEEAFRVVAEAKYLGARSHRYEIGGMVCHLDGAEQWTYSHMGAARSRTTRTGCRPPRTAGFPSRRRPTTIPSTPDPRSGARPMPDDKPEDKPTDPVVVSNPGPGWVPPEIRVDYPYPPAGSPAVVISDDGTSVTVTNSTNGYASPAPAPAPAEDDEPLP